MLRLKSITFFYRMREDRLLAGINLSQADSWACWLTRRLSLALLDGSEAWLASRSPLRQRTAQAHHRELAAFEREAALASTAHSVSVTPSHIIDAKSDTAELVERLGVSIEGEALRLELAGERGGSAAGIFQPAEFQRMLRMLEAEVGKAGWVAPVAPSAEPAPPEAPAPARH